MSYTSITLVFHSHNCSNCDGQSHRKVSGRKSSEGGDGRSIKEGASRKKHQGENRSDNNDERIAQRMREHRHERWGMLE